MNSYYCKPSKLYQVDCSKYLALERPRKVRISEKIHNLTKVVIHGDVQKTRFSINTDYMSLSNNNRGYSVKGMNSLSIRLGVSNP